MRAPRWLVAAAAGVLVVACSSSPGTDGDTSPSPPAATDAATPSPPAATDAATPSPPPVDGPEDGAASPAPNQLLAFSGRQLDGGTFDGSVVTGDVVVWFWTPW
ncbi:hypothetical protein [Nitriliruptor alkaliphilus]|uniref:hypothetical protein n=1 Tax=Nitriliruptor alkaliphilus TaxID=427918 RepID=UPI0006972BAC|nr:hypothetical protein [Nitriliruptor alkaliphilus]